LENDINTQNIEADNIDTQNIEADNIVNQPVRELVDFSRNATGVLIKNLDELAIIRKMNYNGVILLAPSLYAYNSCAVDMYKKLLPDALFMSPEELTLSEIEKLNVQPLLKLYGRQRVMVSANCINNNYYSCDYPETKTRTCAGTGKLITLTDEMGNKFYTKHDCTWCYNVIYNGVPTSILDKIEQVADITSSYYLEFTNERPELVEEILQYVISHTKEDDHTDNTDTGGFIQEINVGEFTRGHYIKGVD
jgi:putative protease